MFLEINLMLYGLIHLASSKSNFRQFVKKMSILIRTQLIPTLDKTDNYTQSQWLTEQFAKGV